MIAPIKGTFRVSQIYKGAAHKGIDLVCETDKTIYSTVDGVVEAARWDNPTNRKYGMGKYVRIRDGKGYRYYFAHLSSLCVGVGQTVKRGQKIGVEGSTGHSSGSHLHYEVRRSTDNMSYMDISQISGIPNKIGRYTVAEREDEMTEAEIRSIIRDEVKKAIAAELSGEDKPVSDWAVPFWRDRTADGTVDGTRPQGVVTREQAATMMSKLIARFGGK